MAPLAQYDSGRTCVLQRDAEVDRQTQAGPRAGHQQRHTHRRVSQEEHNPTQLHKLVGNARPRYPDLTTACLLQGARARWARKCLWQALSLPALVSVVRRAPHHHPTPACAWWASPAHNITVSEDNNTVARCTCSRLHGPPSEPLLTHRVL